MSDPLSERLVSLYSGYSEKIDQYDKMIVKWLKMLYEDYAFSEFFLPQDYTDGVDSDVADDVFGDFFYSFVRTYHYGEKMMEWGINNITIRDEFYRALEYHEIKIKEG